MGLHEKEFSGINIVLSVRKYISITSHVSGRVRLKASMEILKHPALNSLAGYKEDDATEAAKKIRGVVDVRLNIKARSLVVQYDPEEIAPADLINFIETKDESIAKALLDKYMGQSLLMAVE